MTNYGQQTNYTLGSTAYIVNIGQSATKGTLWVNIANNSIAGSNSGTTVQVLPNGSLPGYSVAYGSQENFEFDANGLAFISIAGSGANVSFSVDTSEIPIRSVVITATTLPNVSNTQIAITSNSRATGTAGTGDTAVGIGSSDTLLYSLANSSSSGRVYVLPSFVGSYSGATGTGTAQVTAKKLMSTGTTKWPVWSVEFAVAASTTYYFSVTSEGGLLGTSTDLNFSLSMSQPFTLFPGETLYVYGQSSGTTAGSVACNSDYVSEVE